MMSIQTDPGLVKRGAMGLGHARGVLDLHRGHFRFYFGETAKAIVRNAFDGGFFLAMGVDNGQSMTPLTLGISSWFIFLHMSTAVLVFSCE